MELIERTWFDTKNKSIRQMRGTAPKVLQSHLNEAAYRYTHRGKDLFTRILMNVRALCRP